ALAGAARRRDEALERRRASGENLRRHEMRCAELRRALSEQLGDGDPHRLLELAEAELAAAEEASGGAEAAAQQAQAAELDAAHRLELSRQEERVAGEREEASRARRQRLEEELAAAEKAASAAEAELIELLGDGEPRALLDAARRRLAAAEEALANARRDEQAAGERAAAARRRDERAKRDEQQLASRLANLAGSLGAAISDAADDPSPPSLAALKARVDALREAAQAAASEQLERARADGRRAAAERNERLAALGLAADADFEDLLRRALAARERDAATVAELERRIERAGELARQLDEAQARLDLYRRLADDLAPSRFLRYLLDEERAALAELGGEQLEMLSGGRYRFTADGSFNVVDLAGAEAVRKAETLSGGETFLASLALALALADKVTASGGRLDAFFLDEGFGSLDDEHLELAMAGIERLVLDAPDRLVVVVSHVAALRDRVDDLIILDKDPASGHTRVLQGATLDA
ncbi:MAG: hypothetical protein D6696_10520, partial [Acidobacteria bacterium]